MRMWMVDPRSMCDKHLLGEHVETHMFVGTIQKGIGVKGYLEGGLLEPRNLWTRHDLLAEEMKARGMKHRSPLPRCDITALPDVRVDTDRSLAELGRRCPDCRMRQRDHLQDQS